MLSKRFHRKKREELSEIMRDGTIEIFDAGEPKTELGDQEYPFVPDADFYYLTGLDDVKSAKLAAVKKDDKTDFCLFIKRTDKKSARWTGEAYTASSIKKRTGIKNVKYLDEADDFINENRKNCVLKKKHSDLSVLRYIKDKEEIEAHRIAAQITKEGVNSILSNLRPGIHEYEVEACFDYVLKSRNAGHAFQTIAASGKNACVLHYDKKDSLIKKGDMVLFDLGAKWNGYCCDVSRTYPANGRFSRLQKKLYSIVLDGLKAAENAAKPGVCKNDLQKISKKVMAEGLVKAGIIKDPEEISRYYFHGSGHYIGLFTHDVGDNNASLVPDMMFTLEPGLYFDDLGIGIRIEDTILVTENGIDILTDDIPKEIEDIESFVRSFI